MLAVRTISGASAEALRNTLGAVGWMLGGYGGYQGIRWDPGQRVYFGASESRKDGQAAGY